MRIQAESPCGSSISVMLVNLAALLKELLSSALCADEGVNVTASVTSATELLAALDLSIPDVALVGALGLAHEASASIFLEILASRAPGVRCVVIAPTMDQEDVVSFLHGGAKGLLCASGMGLSVLNRCLHSVAEGRVWASATQLETLLGAISTPKPVRVTDVLGDALLSKREEEVLHLLADGMSNRELASTLKLSEHTIKNHLFRIFDKLGVSNRMEAVLYLISQRDEKRPVPQAREVASSSSKPKTAFVTANRLQ